MKAVILGKGGQVATELARSVPGGVAITVLGRPEFDLVDPEACAEVLRAIDADVILNAAAYTAVDRAESEEDIAMRINAEAPATFANVAAQRGIPLIHVSTDYVYDGSGNLPFGPDSSTGPLGAYGRTKLMGDLGVAAAGGPHAILRTSWVFSAHGSNFVKTMLRLGPERDALSIVSDQIGGPTPAAAIADAMWCMAEAFHTGTAASGIYHFSGGPDTSWANFAHEIFMQSGIACQIQEIPTSAYQTVAERPLNSRLDCTSLAETFGIERPDWRSALSDVLKELGETR